VFFHWNSADRRGDFLHLLRLVLKARETLPSFFGTSVDEKVVSVALRGVGSAPNAVERAQLITDLLQACDAKSARRRMFAPVFELAAATKDSDMMVRCLQQGLAMGLEFWDADYHFALQAIATPSSSQRSTSGDAPLVRILRAMESHHPVVGASNIAEIQRILGDGESEIQLTIDPNVGTCSRCGEALRCFDFSEEDRQSFATDILEKLIRPRLRLVSHYEGSAEVTEDVFKKRETQLTEFMNRIRTQDFNAVIDGANVGYYGLSNWYSASKSELLVSRGLDVSRVSWGELHQVPFPVDVSPQLDVLDDMLEKVRRQGLRPVIVLHERHTQKHRDAVVPRYHTILDRWMEQGALIPSPAFLNDDYCWLLAAVLRPKCYVVTNDLMRDHHFSMLSQRNFLRWRQRYRITYRAGVSPHTHAVTLMIRAPRPFSTWVQQNAASGRWHIPFLRSIPILDQATNRIRTATDPARDDLEKDGDDPCDAWLCTNPL